MENNYNKSDDHNRRMHHRSDGVNQRYENNESIQRSTKYQGSNYRSNATSGIM
jgi:hypothetical protein